VTGFDRALAFESGWRNACEPSPDHRVGRAGVGQSRFTGRPSRGVDAAFSWVIEGAISDAALGHFAQLLASAEVIPQVGAIPPAGATPLAGSTRTRQHAPLIADKVIPPVGGTPSPARYQAFARYFTNRAKSYRQLFDPTVGFFRGDPARPQGFDPARLLGFDPTGSPGFNPTWRLGLDSPARRPVFDPPTGATRSDPTRPRRFDPNQWGGDYTETNAWGMSVSAVHDGPGLARLFGGPAGLRRHLDRLFATPELARDPGGYGRIIHEQREARAVRAGMCAISNQPAHHIPHMYTASDQPWRAGPVVRELARRLFTGGHIGQGYPGDEDNGEMSAWWLWALLGLYPLELASGDLLIGCPLVDDLTVARSDGSRLRVRSSHRDEGECLLEARLNGRPLTRALLPIDALRGGGDVELALVFGSNPQDSPLWSGGYADSAASPSAQSPDSPWCPDLSRPDWSIGPSTLRHASAFNDWSTPGSFVALASGDWVGQRFPHPIIVTDITLTTLDASSAGCWEVERSDDGEQWERVAPTHREALPSGRTTPFQLSEPRAACCWRIRFDAPVRLAQVEFFSLDLDPRWADVPA
jgi:hypothetical protein